MGGIILDQPLPQRHLDMVDPFLLIHHWDDTLPGNQLQSKVGVGPHPHRGFAPVTFVFNGGVHHRDSTGHESVVYGGGTQWMNSGKGIVHSERPSKDLATKGGRFELIQFWVNVPADHKFDQATYQPLQKEDTPQIESSDGRVSTGVVAGAFEGKVGKIDTKSDLLILRHDLKAGGRLKVSIPLDYNTLIYNLDGALSVNDQKQISEREMVVFNNDGPFIMLEAMADTRVILLAGKPINEPVVSYGPFVMNTEKEVMDAINDYQQGRLGTLVEKFD